MTRCPSPSMKPRLRHLGTAIVFALAPLALPTLADVAGEPAGAAVPLESYDRLLPLEGGSNFRDMGGYFTADGRQVRRGLLFRSGAMTSLTQEDQAYLDGFDFKRVIDLRSSEERDLYPNHWAAAQDVELIAHDYSMRDLVGRMVDENGELKGMAEVYRYFPEQLAPQMTLFFDALVAGEVPLVVNCSAGQDRTGLTSALLLIALGVPRDVVVQDYLQSTRYRRPAVERGDVDLVAAAEDNWFAKMMLRYAEEREGNSAAQPLLTDDGVPFLRFALDHIEQDFGSVEAYLEERIGVDAADLAQLRERFLVATYAAP